MGNGYVDAAIRRTTRNLRRANLIMLVCVLILGLLSFRYLYNYAYGPFPMDRETLLSLRDPDTLRNYYVTVQSDQVTDTGVKALGAYTSKSHTTRILVGHYMLANFGNRVLLVKAPLDHAGAEFTGALQAVTTDEVEALTTFHIMSIGQKEVLLPFMMDATDFRADGTPWVVAGIGVIVVALWNLWKAVRRTLNPEAHPLFRTLSAYGPIASVVASVDAEAAGGNAMRFGRKGNTVLTPHWLLNQTLFGVRAVHLDDLVWVYERVTHGKGGTYHSAVLWTDKGTQTVIPDRADVVMSILAHVQEHAPWAQVGNAPEIAKAWRTNRQEMIQKVAQRQRELKTQSING